MTPNQPSTVADNPPPSAKPGLNIQTPRTESFLRAAAMVFFLGGPLLGLLAGYLARGLENQNAAIALSDYVSARAAILKRDTFAITEALYHTRAFFNSSARVTRDGFKTFTADILSRHPVIAAVEWIPRVAGNERVHHERQAQTEGLADYQIRARTAPGKMAAAPLRDVYYPIFYFEPIENGRQVLGLDVSLMDPARKSVLELAIQTNQITITDPIDLVHVETPSKGFLAVLPHYAPSVAADTTPPRLQGLVAVVIRAQELFIRAVGVEPRETAPKIYFELIDEDVKGKRTVLASSWTGDVQRSFLPQNLSVPLELGGQRWSVRAQPSQTFMDEHRTAKPLALGFGVFFFWELLGGIILVVTKRSHDIALRQQSLLYESAVQSLNEGLIVANSEGHLLFFNASAQRILGLGMQDVQLPDWSETYGCFYPDTTTPFPSERLPLARALRGENITEELFIRNARIPQGIWISSSGAPITSERGELKGGVVTIRDISEWKLASESLRLSLKELKDLKHAVDQAAIVSITNPAGEILYVNPKFCEISGYSEDELLGQNHRLLNSGYHFPTFFTDLWATISAGSEWRGVIRNRSKDGSFYWLDTTIVPMLNESGKCERYLGISTDVTSGKLQEQNLQLLSSAVEQTADAVFITDPAGVISYVNPAFESITGFSREDALGETPRILKSGTNPPAYYEELWQTIVSGKSFRSLTINRKKSGRLFEAEQTITPIKDSAGKIANFVSVLKDITDRVMRQRQEIEMRYAAQVQQQLYPAHDIDTHGYDIAGASFSAEFACGDYYDYLESGDGSLCLALGDVSGHGLAPAMIMTSTRSYLRFLVRSESDLSNIMLAVNEALYADLERSRFVALLLVNIDMAARRFMYVNAGMSEGFVLDAAGSIKAVLSISGPPLGLLPAISYGSGREVALDSGDIIVLMTDGVIEARDPIGNFFDTDAAIAVVKAHRNESSRQIVQHLYEEVRRFSQDAPQLDDITAIVCKVGTLPGASI